MSQDICQQIILAAERRFADYGYRKTTMVEIASDCQMSVGNLYRFFDSKTAIARSCVESILHAKYQAGVLAAEQHEEPRQRLHAFLLARLRYAHARVVGHRHLFELILEVGELHRDLLLQQEARVIEYMQAIILRGMDEKTIRRMDSYRCAHLIHQSLLRYNIPLSLQANALPDLEHDLMDYLDLLFAGLNADSTGAG